MDKVILEMTFKNAADSKVNISVDNPREDLTEAEIKTTMDLIVAKNLFNTTGGDIVQTVGARRVTTTVQELEI
jgi:predicted DNA-binding protein (UPF0251 family)